MYSCGLVMFELYCRRLVTYRWAESLAVKNSFGGQCRSSKTEAECDEMRRMRRSLGPRVFGQSDVCTQLLRI